MTISKYTNLEGLYYTHEKYESTEVKRIINELLGHDYFPSMFNNSTRFLALKILNERELVFKDKCFNPYGNYTVTCIKILKIDRRARMARIKTLFSCDNPRKINKLYNEITQYSNNKILNSSKKITKFLEKKGVISAEEKTA